MCFNTPESLGILLRCRLRSGMGLKLCPFHKSPGDANSVCRPHLEGRGPRSRAFLHFSDPQVTRLLWMYFRHLLLCPVNTFEPLTSARPKATETEPSHAAFIGNHPAQQVPACVASKDPKTHRYLAKLGFCSEGDPSPRENELGLG